MSRRRSTSSAAADRAVKATVSRHAALWWPAAIWVLLWLLSESAHLLFTLLFPEYLYWTGIFLTVIVCFMTFVAGGIAHRRRRRTTWDVPFVAATTLLAGMWVVASVYAGPLAPALMVAWVTVGLSVVVLWMIRMVMERRDAEAEAAGATVSRGTAAEMFLESAVGAQGHRAQITAATPNYVDVGVDLVESDATVADLKAASNKLAGAAGLAPGSVRFAPTGRAEQYRMRVVLQDTLISTIPWPGPAYPGRSVFAPYPMGLYEDGELAVKYVADRDGARNQGTFGMTGSGKGNGARIEVAEHISREETSVTVIDTVKGIQTFGPLAEGLDWFILDMAQARALFRRIMRVLQGRFNYLGAQRLDSWRPGCGLMFWPIQVEEASHLDVNPSDAEDLAKACRGAGVRLIWSLQSAQHTQMPVTLRRQLGQHQVYGCNDDFDQDALPDEVTSGGVALPNQWAADHPGRNLLLDKGLPLERKQTPLRDFGTHVAQLETVARRWGSRPLDKITADLLGDLYANRQRPADMVAAIRVQSLGALRPAPAPAAAQDPPTAPLAAVRDTDDDDAEFEPMTTEELTHMGVIPADPSPELQLSRDDLQRPIPAVPPDQDVPIGEPAPPGGYVPTAEDTAAIRRTVWDRIDQFERAGAMYIAPPDLADLVGVQGPRTRSRGWMRKELMRLEEIGRLRFDPDERKFQILPDPTRVGALID